ncbi:MAG: HAD family phosphatase [Vicinamibacterales bacterium]
MLRAIVFDFDGVIANSEPLHYQAYRDVLAEAGVSFSEREYYARYLGFDDVGMFRTLMADRGLTCPSGRVTELVTRKAARLEQLERDVSILFPGADVAIRSAAATVPLAIASGALGAEIRRTLDREHLAGFFSVIVAAEDTPVSKPAPDPYLRALALLAETAGRPMTAAECVAIEDSPWGLQSARAAGFHTVAVAQTYDAATLDADLVISSLGSLDLKALERLCST